MVSLSKAFGCRAKSMPDALFILRHIYQNMPQCMTNYQLVPFCLEPVTPDPDMNLPNLQFWNCMDYGVVSVTKQFIGSMDFECYTRDYESKKALMYALWTIITKIQT